MDNDPGRWGLDDEARGTTTAPAAAPVSAELPPRPLECSEAMQKAIADMSSGATNIQLLCKSITDEDVAVLAEALKAEQDCE